MNDLSLNQQSGSALTKSALSTHKKMLPSAIALVMLGITPAFAKTQTQSAGSDSGVTASVEQKTVVDLGSTTVIGNSLGLNTEQTDSYTTKKVGIGRTVEALKDIPNSVNVVTNQQIKDKNMTTLNDALAQTTGVSVMSFGAGTAQYIMRGFNTDSIGIDGNQTSATSRGTHGQGAPDLTMYDRVEVLKGPAGLLQGSAEPGGYINLVRKRALADSKLSLATSVNSWEGFRVAADATGALSEDKTLRGRAVAAYEDSKSYLDGVDTQKNVVYATLEYDFLDNNTVSVGVSREDEDTIPDIGVPLYADGRLPAISRKLYTGSPYNSKNSTTTRAFLEYEHFFDNGALISATVNDSNNKMDYLLQYTTSSIDPDTGLSNRRVIATDNELDETTYDLRFELPYQLASMDHKLMLGLHNRESKLNSKSYVDNNYPPINVFDPKSADNPDPRPNVQYGYFRHGKEKESGFYLKSVSHLTDSTQLILGGRLINWEVDDGKSQSELDNEVTPYVGVVYAINDSTNLYASASESLVPQQYRKDVNDKLLEPRIGNQIELGVKGELEQGDVNYHLAAFQITDENRAISDPNNPQAFIAGGKVKAKGFESEITGRLTDNLDVVAGYAYTKTEQVKSDNPKTEGLPFAPDAPEHQVNLWGKYTINPSWEAGLGLVYSSGTFAEEGDIRWEQNGYTTYSAMLAYALDDSSRFVLSGTNLTDKRYFSRLSGSFGRQSYFGDPRQVKLSFETSF